MSIKRYQCYLIGEIPITGSIFFVISCIPHKGRQWGPSAKTLLFPFSAQFPRHCLLSNGAPTLDYNRCCCKSHEKFNLLSTFLFLFYI